MKHNTVFHRYLIYGLFFLFFKEIIIYEVENILFLLKTELVERAFLLPCVGCYFTPKNKDLI